MEDKFLQGSNRVLLAFLPFWTPYIPPQGLTVLKTHLTKNNVQTKVVDPNVDQDFRVLYNDYFNLLLKYIPYTKRGNFYNIGHDVMANHMMAHVNQDNEDKYLELVKTIIYNTYYQEVEQECIFKLNSILDSLFQKLELYIINELENYRPKVFGVTAYSGTLASCIYILRLVKEKFPKVKTCIGGGSFADQLVKGTPNYELFLKKTPFIDKIFIGECHETLLKWIKGELDDRQNVYFNKELNISSLDINSGCDIPDLSDLDTKKYLYMASVASRSCPYECSFCNVKNFWGDHRKKRIKQTIDEMIVQYKMHNNQLFFLYDSLLNTIIDELSTEMYESEYSLYYVGYLRACKEATDLNKTINWRKGGFYRARLGFESGSQRMLDIIGKKITPSLIKETLAGLAYAGIKTTGYFIIGHPEETEEDFQITLDLIKECKNLFWEVECNPFNYYYTGQQSANLWADKRKLLYPEYSSDWLISQTWTLDIEPQREEVYRRMNRFVQFCDKLGIPNPYSIKDIYEADKRWKKLHKNAVPSVAELRDDSKKINECKSLELKSSATSNIILEGDFGF